MNFLNKTCHWLLVTGNFFLDCLFPKNCVGCQKEGKWICDKCYSKIVFIKQATCPNCNKLTKDGKFCINCRKKTNLTGLITAAYYEDGPLKEAIHTFKYGGVFDLSKDLGKIMRKTISDQRFAKNTILIPVPLHKKRRSQRGYNQAELLTKQIANSQWLIVNNKLIRHKHQKKSQAELSGKARRQNLIDCFSWVGGSEVTNKIVVLIDDVYTTGATLEECAKVLKKAKAKEVWGLVLAKA